MENGCSLNCSSCEVAIASVKQALFCFCEEKLCSVRSSSHTCTDAIPWGRLTGKFRNVVEFHRTWKDPVFITCPINQSVVCCRLLGMTIRQPAVMCRRKRYCWMRTMISGWTSVTSTLPLSRSKYRLIPLLKCLLFYVALSF